MWFNCLCSLTLSQQSYCLTALRHGSVEAHVTHDPVPAGWDHQQPLPSKRLPHRSQALSGWVDRDSKMVRRICAHRLQIAPARHSMPRTVRSVCLCVVAGRIWCPTMWRRKAKLELCWTRSSACCSPSPIRMLTSWTRWSWCRSAGTWWGDGGMEGNLESERYHCWRYSRQFNVERLSAWWLDAISKTESKQQGIQESEALHLQRQSSAICLPGSNSAGAYLLVLLTLELQTPLFTLEGKVVS